MVDISLKTLVIINIILFFTLLLLFGYLLLQKHKDIKRKLRKARIKEKIRDGIFEHLNEGQEVKTRLFQRDPLSYEVVQELLLEYGTMVKGDEEQKRLQQFAEFHFSSYYQELLSHQNWSIRMNTLYSIENLSMKSMETDVWNHFAESTYEETVEQQQQIRVLAKLQSEKLASHLFVDKNIYPLPLYKEVLRTFQTDLFDQMVGRYDEANETLKVAILAIFAEKNDTSYLPLVERELENGHTDIRLQALKVIRSFGYVGNIELFSTFATSSLWQERMLFCKIAAVITKERFKETLVRLIGDESWWVRNAAGEALANYHDGDFILTHISEENEDSFARDMAKQWLGGEETAKS
ncbi:hypothetical protein DS745_08755 [Anaerobacillus alkaliphilus]|uniref:HEAT repeat domain-containing protein n=1 Tax=Anaerobacillus alkaliphilus TaxID=1548597 RepID=A0A4Q0VWK7_9BACI|nr:hypothetical protein [Anaerobacillus alkaliphilus]RXJ01914.1 hypothetical protein DS745_08755 [Anaerobacillus alkaliphilus]